MIAGEVFDWGRNDFGGLGTGTTTDALKPARMRSALGGIAAVSMGVHHSLLLRSTGRIRACGWNHWGQVGDGTTTDRLTIVDVPGLDQVIAVSAGYPHSLALRRDGTVWAWGENFYGQLGDGTRVNRTTSVPVIGIPPCVAISASFGHHSMALADDGGVWVWGYNAEGQHGNGTSDPVTGVGATPDRVSGLEGVVAIAAGSWHCTALRSDGSVWAWGDNSWGQLGDGTTTNRFTPVAVNGPGNIVAIGRGGGHSVALRDDGTVWAWGINDRGQLGDGTTGSRATPAPVAGLADVTLLAGTGSGGVAVTADGLVRAWGRNDRGQIGDGTTTDRLVPVTVPGLPRVVSVDGGAHMSAAIVGQEAGTAVSWGANDYGQLGDASTIDRLTPVPVLAGQLVTAKAGEYHTSAVDAASAVLGWGNNGAGQLGTGSSGDSQVPVEALFTDAAAVAAGQHHTVALRADGTAWAWGANGSGELGDGRTLDSQTPVQVGGLSEVVGVAAGIDHSLALLADGTVWAWGNNGFGQLGDGAPGNSRAVADTVPGLADVRAIAAGGWHNLALRADGTVWAWGLNDLGQLGDGSTTTAFSPVQVPLPLAIAAIAAGGWHSLACGDDGTCWRWGYDGVGPIRNGFPIAGAVTVPTRMTGLTKVRDVAGSLYHSLALRQDGYVTAWGSNNRGALGDGTTTNSATPVAVSGATDVVAIAAGAAFSLALIGPRKLRPTPARLNFGHQQVGTASTPRTVWLANVGRRPIAVSEVRVVDDRNDFALLGTSCPPILVRGKSCQAQIVFHPTQRRPGSGSLVISSDALGSPHRVELTGVGIA
jgi:alpha-tubulin suppressor-like RCC1 family protein